MRVAVLKGGSSLERVVSLRSAARVEDALGGLGHEAIGIDVGQDLVRRLRADRPDIVFIALHGPGGEDGTVQELLEILDLPYTGPGVAACALCMDKIAAKHEMHSAELPTPDWAAFNATWYSGGTTSVDGVSKANPQRNSRVGATLSLPLASRQSIKIAYSTGATTRIGGDFDTIAVAWQMLWIR